MINCHTHRNHLNHFQYLAEFKTDWNHRELFWSAYNKFSPKLGSYPRLPNSDLVYIAENISH